MTVCSFCILIGVWTTSASALFALLISFGIPTVASWIHQTTCGYLAVFRVLGYGCGAVFPHLSHPLRIITFLVSVKLILHLKENLVYSLLRLFALWWVVTCTSPSVIVVDGFFFDKSCSIFIIIRWVIQLNIHVRFLGISSVNFWHDVGTLLYCPSTIIVCLQIGIRLGANVLV